MILHALLLFTVADVPAPIADQRVQTLNLGKLSFRDAQQIKGQYVPISFVVDSLEGEYAGAVTVDAEATAGVFSTVHFAPRSAA